MISQSKYDTGKYVWIRMHFVKYIIPASKWIARQ